MHSKMLGVRAKGLALSNAFVPPPLKIREAYRRDGNNVRVGRLEEKWKFSFSIHDTGHVIINS